jgi:hypothetical protein
MSQGTPNPQINVSKIVAGGGIAGALFAVISTAIFLIGIPALRYFLPAAIILGCLVALVIHFKRHETPGQPWILAPAKPDRVTPDAPSPRTMIPSLNLS